MAPQTNVHSEKSVSLGASRESRATCNLRVTLARGYRASFIAIPSPVSRVLYGGITLEPTRFITELHRYVR